MDHDTELVLIMVFIIVVVLALHRYYHNKEFEIARKIAFSHPEYYPELDIDQKIRIIQHDLFESKRNSHVIHPVYMHR